MTDGIRWRTRTGVPWRDVPERHGARIGSTTCSGVGGAMAPGPGSSLGSQLGRTRRA
ncbi:hypothetical protein [Streptomyces sp. NBC_00986]|uniref:hypothetical protein n=1 Tax=Streptomyces sp. NBC_00986 TaxID=2903702 RepID=UPI0038702892